MVRKASTTKAPTKKSSAKKTPAKKAAAKKASAKKALTKKAGTKKSSTKKAARKRAPSTRPEISAVEPPPYKCETTDETGVCLRFNRNPVTGQYNLPAGGIRMNCSECQWFF
jgi:hypothetical protein